MTNSHSIPHIDYHITFPSSVKLDGHASSGQHCQDGCLRAEINEREPVVFLLGWAGCVDKHLAKYVGIYDMKGFITIRYTLPIDVIFLRNSLSEPIAKKLLEIILEYELTQHKIFFHTFSNGGCLLYQHVSRLIENDASFSELKICGVTCDSGPTRISVSNSVKAYSMSISHYSTIVRWVCVSAFILIYFLGTIVNFFQSLAGGTQLNVYNVYEVLAEDSGTWPQLYLYSKFDELCASSGILEMVKRRRSKGIDVSEFCWEDTTHVRHFTVHRDAYIHQCHRFMDRCLAVTNP